MSKGKSRENYVGHIGTTSTTLRSERAGIPHRVSEDLCVELEEGIRVYEGDTLEVIYRGSLEWWTVILAEDNALIHSALLEPIMGSLDVGSLSSIEISDCEPPPFSGAGRKLVILTPLRPTGRFVDVRPPASLVTTPSSSTEIESLVEPARTLEGIRLLPPQVRAVRDFTASNAGELSYKKGDIIDVELRSTAEQWQGRLGTQVGSFRLDRSVEPIVGDRVIALWDYSSSTPNDLNFKSGDIIEVCGTSGASKWWMHGWMPSKGFGLFPYNFVESLEDEFPDSGDDRDAPSPLSPVEKTTTRFRVLKDVVGIEDGALPLKRGDIIHVVERQGDERWLGRVNHQMGTFLLDNCVEPIMPDRVKALFSYSTSNPEELSFVINDNITVTGPSDDSTMWWYGTLNEKVGLFPINFVEFIPDERDAKNDTEDWFEVIGEDKEHEEFAFMDSRPSQLSEKDEKSFSQAQQEQTSKYVDPSERFDDISRDTEQLAFRRGDPVEVPDMSSPDSRDTSLLHSQHSQSPNDSQKLPPPIAVRIPSPKLSTITDVMNLATRPSNDPISASPVQLTPTKHSDHSPPFVVDAPYSLPWSPCFARALYEFGGKDPGELGFLRGDVIQILAMTSTDWWVGELRYQTGRVPTHYLDLINLKGQSQISDEGRTSIEGTISAGGGTDASPQIRKGSSNPLPDGPRHDSSQRLDRKRGTDKETLSRAERVRARHGWNSQKTGELVFQAGDTIQVLKRPFEHWWKGRLESNGQTGLFPANFVEAVPSKSPEHLKAQGFSIGNDDPVIALRFSIAKLLPLLQGFDRRRDIAENAEIQTLFETSCNFRRKVLRLLAEKPDDGKPVAWDWIKTLNGAVEELKRLDTSFQEVKTHYEEVLELCARRALEQDAERKPWIPRATIEVGSFEKEQKQPNAKNKRQIPSPKHQLPSNVTKEATAQRRNTEASMHRLSLPPTPAPDLSALASMLNKRNSKEGAGEGRRYSGRLSAIEADIKRAKRAYQESIRPKEDAKPRRLPTTQNSIAILRSVRDRITSRKGTNADRAPDNKTIVIPKAEYIHTYVFYENK